MIVPAPLCPTPTLVAISDFCDGWPPADGHEPSVADFTARWRDGSLGPAPTREGGPGSFPVVGGYLERLPLACVEAGLVDHAEIWHHWRPDTPGPFSRDSPVLARRAFRLGHGEAPFRSNSMRGFVEAFGAPKILCVWGLGIDAALLDLCANSFKIYNSIDAPALRVPPDVSGRFDLILTGAEWQSREVRERHPGMACAVLPIGPEFADPETFRPLGIEKRYDIVYVAAAQPYKRHDILFDAMARASRPLSALCVIGYGDDDLRRQAADRGLAVDFVGPPGVPFAEVNRLMNSATIGVVCGIDDGAPAILTEYMLAGLPVLANARLRCGLQYIEPGTGRMAEPEAFAEALVALVEAAPAMDPRKIAIERWTWPNSVRTLRGLMGENPRRSALGRSGMGPIGARDDGNTRQVAPTDVNQQS